jgi:regulation of enolase protein 1 (concanavalin A-like superfamily)
MDLFHASTIVTVGNGEKTKFWHSSWLQGAAPKSIAPSLFRRSRRKNFTVQRALKNNYWVTQIYPLQSTEEILEYVTSWGGGEISS